MADRNQNYSPDSRRSQQGREDQNQSSRGDDRGERSQGNYPGYGNFGQGDYGRRGPGANAGPERGRSGYGRGGDYGYGGDGQAPRYGREQGSSGTSNYGRSNYGSGRSGGRGFQGWTEPSGEGQQYDSGSDGAGFPDSQYGSPAAEQWGGGSGLHRGKGPKGYQRSDERLKELICERLQDDPHIDASDITLQVQDGRITLEGTVDSRRTKFAAEDVAEQFGVNDVQNNLRIARGRH